MRYAEANIVADGGADGIADYGAHCGTQRIAEHCPNDSADLDTK
jgi:hypothetical protein